MVEKFGWVLPLVCAVSAHAAEIDSVTARNVELRNSMRPMNQWVNARIRSGVERANQEAEGCDEDELYDQVQSAISWPFIGHAIAEKLNDSEDLDSRRVMFRDSIYRDLGVFDAVSVRLKDLSAVVRMGDHLVGVDKMGHFFVEGWEYFDSAYRDGEGILEAMSWGEGTERTYFGFYTTGIYSYADLATNFEGMRFWLRLLATDEDPLEPGYFANRPYVSCKRRFFFGKRRWKVSRKVDLGDYVTGAWDEGVNCSNYRNAKIQALVERRVHEREEVDSESYACPVEPDQCARARGRYGDFADRLLHPDCLGAEAEPRAWWRLW